MEIKDVINEIKVFSTQKTFHSWFINQQTLSDILVLCDNKEVTTDLLMVILKTGV